jgi:hypothetical protein
MPVPPTSTPVPIPCNWAKFVGDVTVKDGTEFTPNVEFVKTWELKNIGSCSWKSDTLLVFAGGEQMDGASPRRSTRLSIRGDDRGFGCWSLPKTLDATAVSGALHCLR